MIKSGYHFTGWLGDNSVTYTDGQTISLNADFTHTLTAQWAINTYSYSITFDRGTGTSGALSSQSGTDTSVTLSAFSTGNMVKSGYHFTGWLGDNSVTYTDGQTISLSTDFTHTLTAQWAINTYSYTITFAKGTGDSGTLAQQTGTGTSVTLSAFSTGNMVKSGYHFTGWLGDNSTTYTDGQTISLSTDFTHTLTAQWAINTYAYTITFAKGTGDSGTLAQQTGTASSVTLSLFSTGTMVKSGYHFTGWRDGTGTNYTDGQTISLSSAFTRTLTAQWAANTYSITFNKGTGDSGTLASQSGSGASVTLRSFSTGNMAKANYHFVGWLGDDSVSYSDGQTISLTSNFTHTLTAQWATDFKTITSNSFLPNNATNASIVITSEDLRPGITLADINVAAGTTGLTASLVTWQSSTQITVNFTGTAAPGDLDIFIESTATVVQQLAASNTLTFTVSTMTLPAPADFYDVWGSPLDSPVVLTAVGGVGPYTYSVWSGVIPAGLSINQSTGEIEGSAQQASNSVGFTSTVQILVRDSSNPRQAAVCNPFNISVGVLSGSPN